MVKSWANDFVRQFETEFAAKIDWDKVKEERQVWTKEVRDGWTYEVGAFYWPADYRPELYEITFKKHNIGHVKTKKEIKRFSMWGEKRSVDKSYDKKSGYIKRGEWLYNGFLTYC